jgi:hypothetical protein
VAKRICAFFVEFDCPPELIGRIALTHTEGLNMRGIFSFPIEQYAEALLPSWITPKIDILGP